MRVAPCRHPDRRGVEPAAVSAASTDRDRRGPVGDAPASGVDPRRVGFRRGRGLGRGRNRAARRAIQIGTRTPVTPPVAPSPMPPRRRRPASSIPWVQLRHNSARSSTRSTGRPSASLRGLRRNLDPYARRSRRATARHRSTSPLNRSPVVCAGCVASSAPIGRRPRRLADRSAARTVRRRRRASPHDGP